jgi:hypothetical protein
MCMNVCTNASVREQLDMHKTKTKYNTEQIAAKKKSPAHKNETDGKTRLFQYGSWLAIAGKEARG